jgi:hypothetical protein
MSKLHKRDAYKCSQIILKNEMIDEFYKSLLSKLDDCNLIDIIKRLNYDNIKKSVNEILILIYNRSPEKFIRKINYIHSFTESELHCLSLSEKHYSTYDSFIVFGCPFSTDIDVACFVMKDNYNNGKTYELSSDMVKKLCSELESIGYDITRTIDINPIYVDPTTQMIIASNTNSETQNIINSTWIYHKQIMINEKISTLCLPLALSMHPMKYIEFTKELIHHRIRLFAKFILDYAEELCASKEKYLELRPIKKIIYSDGGNDMIKFVKNNICDHIEILYTNISDDRLDSWKNRFKSIIMKLLQIILMFRHNKTYYTKEELAHSVYELFDTKQEFYYESALYYLFRGNRGVFHHELFLELLKQYSIIFDNLSELVYNMKLIIFDTKSILEIKLLNDILMKQFLESPEVYTEEFEIEWNNTYGDSPINSQFIIPCSDHEYFFSKFSDEYFKNHFIFSNQRSPEWLDLLNNVFICGTNSGNISDSSFQGKYNLIRGAIVETLVINLFMFAGFEKFNIGFIVEENKKGSRGFSPDLVLINNEPIPEIIIVEIKTLKNFKHKNYYRALQLAIKQIESGKKILRDTSKVKIIRGIILLCYIESSKLYIETRICNI